MGGEERYQKAVTLPMSSYSFGTPFGPTRSPLVPRIKSAAQA